MRQMPLHRAARRAQRRGRRQHGLDRDHLIGIAMGQKDGRAILPLRRRPGQKAGQADNGRRRHGAPQADMQRQHGALAEAHQNQPLRRQRQPRQFLVQKLLQHRAGAFHALLHFARDRCGKWETIESRASRAPDRAHWARQRRRRAAGFANAAPARSGHCRPSHSHAPAPPDGWPGPWSGARRGPDRERKAIFQESD